MLLESFLDLLAPWTSADIPMMEVNCIDSYFMTPASWCVGLSRFIWLLRLPMGFHLLCFCSVSLYHTTEQSQSLLRRSVLFHGLNFSTDVLCEWLFFFFFLWQISVLTLSNPWGWRVKGAALLKCVWVWEGSEKSFHSCREKTTGHMVLITALSSPLNKKRAVKKVLFVVVEAMNEQDRKWADEMVYFFQQKGRKDDDIQGLIYNKSFPNKVLTKVKDLRWKLPETIKN